jgi:hypothetical protein
MFARIVVTGLIIDPEKTLRKTLSSSASLIHRIERKRKKETSLQRNVSRSAHYTPAWREASRSYSAGIGKKSSFLPEAPFQTAVARQQSLSAQGRPYLRHSWHRIDMVAVWAFWIMFFLALTGQEATATYHIYIFRALSILRCARLLVITSGTSTILHSLKSAGPLLITVSFFLVFAGCVFSIIGVQSFRGSFRRACILTDPTNSSNLISLSQQCGGYLDPTDLSNVNYLDLDGSVGDVNAKGYICPLDQVCLVSCSCVLYVAQC